MIFAERGQNKYARIGNRTDRQRTGSGTEDSAPFHPPFFAKFVGQGVGIKVGIETYRHHQGEKTAQNRLTARFDVAAETHDPFAQSGHDPGLIAGDHAQNIPIRRFF